MAAVYRDRLGVVPLTGIPLPALLAVVSSSSPSPAVRAFVPGLGAAFGC